MFEARAAAGLRRVRRRNGRDQRVRAARLAQVEVVHARRCTFCQLLQRNAQHGLGQIFREGIAQLGIVVRRRLRRRRRQWRRLPAARSPAPEIGIGILVARIACECGAHAHVGNGTGFRAFAVRGLRRQHGMDGRRVLAALVERRDLLVRATVGQVFRRPRAKLRVRARGRRRGRRPEKPCPGKCGQTCTAHAGPAVNRSTA
jgi:hypothetical protein